MPRIFDNLSQETSLLQALKATLDQAYRADFCVGYFNLRGWSPLAPLVDRLAGDRDAQCRLLIGMHRPPADLLRANFGIKSGDDGVDQQTVVRLRNQAAEEFKHQLTVGTQSNAQEAALRCLSRQLRDKKLVVKLFLKHPLHAKLYLLHRSDLFTPIIGYLGSSNLTFAGLQHQGELNLDVLEQDACQKLQAWFDDRWRDRWCLDISDQLVEIIETSWAREELVAPYLVYLKIAYHLSREARAGLNEFKIPRDFGDRLFDFQKAAVQIAARHLNQRGGVLIGDVVGLGKTLMATALARIFEDDRGTETLIICPKNLVTMWEDYRLRYRLRAKVVSLSQVENVLPELPRFRVVLLDESHNLRNTEGKRYRVIQDYVKRNDSRCILLSATPYNKTYLDLAAQLRLFVEPDEPLGIRPDTYLRQIGEPEFIRRHQCGPGTLNAFEKSEQPDDWRNLMRRYLVRRTRSFIHDNYAHDDGDGLKYLLFADGRRSFFPARVPKTVAFTVDESKPDDQYARLFAPAVVDAVDALALPRYGLGLYLADDPDGRPTSQEQEELKKLSRAGVRLMGFCRTNLFKRLESSGHAFLLSVERHVLRNFVYLHAIENDLPIPIGTQDPSVLDTRFSDADASALAIPDEADDEDVPEPEADAALGTEEDIGREAARVYARYAGPFKKRFKWLRPGFFDAQLARDLRADADRLIRILDAAGRWDPARDAKLAALHHLLAVQHPNDKVLVFSQFADTVAYLTEELKGRGLTAVEGVTGGSDNPTELAWRFSPGSNGKHPFAAQHGELRVLLATDVLSEGQNLQDGHIIVNFDLPWAIIRLIQRAGRVDRIGQEAREIRCYSFLPADGIERVINLRTKVRTRLKQNAEVVGADERFFEDDGDNTPLVNLYNEKAGVLDGERDDDVDLASFAYQIWKNAVDADPKLKDAVANLPDVVYATRDFDPTPTRPAGVLVYFRTDADNDALAWVDQDGRTVTEATLDVLNAAACHPNTRARPRHPDHHDLVKLGAERIVEEQQQVGGQLGNRRSARFRLYERLSAHAQALARPNSTLSYLAPNTDKLKRAIADIYAHPLQQTAVESVNRLLRTGVTDDALAERAIQLREDDRLTVPDDQAERPEPRIICSLGLFPPGSTT